MSCNHVDTELSTYDLETLRQELEATQSILQEREQWIARHLAEMRNAQERHQSKNAELEGFIWQRSILMDVKQAMADTRSWRWTRWFRKLQKLLIPTVLTERNFKPCVILQNCGNFRFRAEGAFPQFLATCIPASGWVRFELEMSTSAASRAFLYFDTGSLFTEKEMIDLGAVAGEVRRDFCFHLSKPVHCFRFDPIRTLGEFELRRLRLTFMSGLQADYAAFKQLFSGADKSHLPDVARTLSRGRFHDARERFRIPLAAQCPDATTDYELWQQLRRLTPFQREQQTAWAASLSSPPLISVLVPVHNTPPAVLRECLESVRRQTYPFWELRITDDASTDPAVRQILKEFCAADSRIHLITRSTGGGISEATNEALNAARGEFIALLDHDDVLAEHALWSVAKSILAHPDASMFYSDEDKLSPQGKRHDPFFKPDWNYELFLGCMYTCHLGVYRTSLVRRIGGFRKEFDGSQDYDMVLRLIREISPSQIIHIPDVLYHWRMVPTSTATSSEAKPHAWLAGRRAIEQHLNAQGAEAQVFPGPSAGMHRVRYALKGRPTVTIVIPSACRPRPDGMWLTRCVDSLKTHSTYHRIEIVAVVPPDVSADVLRWAASSDVRVVHYDLPFNFSQACNVGASAGTGEHILLLNDDVEVQSPDFIEEMLSFSQRPDIGAVGAKLYFPDGTLQHAGVTILHGEPGHPFYRFPRQHPGYFFSSHLHREWIAVTGACLMTRRDVFEQLNGLDTSFPINYNDVDYCLRVRDAGLRVMYTPYAELVHHESVTKSGTFRYEVEAFKARWTEKFPRDPMYNPNLSDQHNDFRIAVGESK